MNQAWTCNLGCWWARVWFMYKIIWQQIVLVIATRFDFLSNTTIQDSWQSLHLYVLLIQDIGSSHSLVSLTIESYHPFIYVSTLLNLHSKYSILVLLNWNYILLKTLYDWNLHSLTEIPWFFESSWIPSCYLFFLFLCFFFIAPIIFTFCTWVALSFSFLFWINFLLIPNPPPKKKIKSVVYWSSICCWMQSEMLDFHVSTSFPQSKIFFGSLSPPPLLWRA